MNNVLFPQITRLPSDAQPIRREETAKTGEEFGKLLDRAVEESPNAPALEEIQAPLKFSAHATQRLKDRKISLDADMMAKIRGAVDQAAAKGLSDALVITDQAALIVNTENRTVITAMDKKSLSGNVFTNIDGAVIV